MTKLPRYLLISLLISPLAHAVLGENESTISTGGAQARVQKTQLSGFVRHEVKEGNLSVKQFAGANGKVFAVGWRGPMPPDLRQLLGTHFGEFQAALAKARQTVHGHSPIQIEVDNIHLELGGHARDVNGRIWLIDQVPNGVSNNDIQ